MIYIGSSVQVFLNDTDVCATFKGAYVVYYYPNWLRVVGLYDKKATIFPISRVARVVTYMNEEGEG